MSAPRAPVLVTGASGFVGLALVEHLLARGDAVVGLDGISKLAAEQAALRLAALHDLDLVVGRLGTCFGPWEADSGVRDTPSAPLQVLRLAERGEEAVLPRPHPRDWLYVRDAAAGLAALLDAPRPAYRTVNVAAGFVRPLADWCRALVPAFPGWRWRIDPDAANVALYASYDRAPMDATRLRADTAFVPRFDLAEAAADFVPWRRRHGATSRVRLQVRPRSVRMRLSRDWTTTLRPEGTVPSPVSRDVGPGTGRSGPTPPGPRRRRTGSARCGAGRSQSRWRSRGRPGSGGRRSPPRRP